MKSTKLLLSLITVFIFLSCKNNNQIISKEKLKNPDDINFKSINNHSFIELTKEDTTYVIYKPCDASILKYRILDSILLIRTHQDGNLKCKIKEIKEINDTVIIVKYKYYDFSPLLDLKFTKKQKYWLINQRLFIDSLYSRKIPYVKQDCKGFFD